MAQISIGYTKAYCKTGNGSVANIIYTHPTAKQCNYSVDTSSFATASDLASLRSEFEKHVEDTKLVGVVTGSIAIGKTVDMGGYTWLVCHISGGEAYLILNTIYEKTIFGSSSEYKNSTLDRECISFYNNLPNNVKNILITKTSEGSSTKVFVPTRAQVNGGFTYFTNDTSRIARDLEGTATDWWTSSTYYSAANNVYYVRYTGSISFCGVRYNNGFRPYVCIPM